MATFEEKIEALTQISISTDTTPTQSQLTDILNDGIKDLINKVTVVRPDESFKFASESIITGAGGVNVTGQIIGVVREYGSATDVRPATPIPAELRGLSTDITSLHYRSTSNPCYYTLNRKLYILPTPTSATTRGIVSQIEYPTVSYSDSAIDDFPDEYENSIVLYATAMSANSAAQSMQNNLPTRPTQPSAPSNVASTVTLPDEPIYNARGFSINVGQVKAALGREDFDLAGKYIELLDKDITKWEKDTEEEQTIFNKDLELYKLELDKLIKDSDRGLQASVAEYKNDIAKYQNDVQEYQAAMTTFLAKYKWFVEAYQMYYAQYTESIYRLAKPKQKQQQPKKKDSK